MKFRMRLKKRVHAVKEVMSADQRDVLAFDAQIEAIEQGTTAGRVH